jgi:hypothetical protein
MLRKLSRKNFFYQLKNGVKIEKCPKYGCFTVFVSYLLRDGQIQLLPAQISDLAGLERICF